MYLIDAMLDKALPDGEKWPSETHREVAATVLLCNPQVRTMDGLECGVEAVLRIPEKRIKTVTLRELVHEFKFPEGFVPVEALG